MNINQFSLRVSSHGPVGTCIKTWGFHTMPALEGKPLSLYINSGHRLRLFIDCLGKLFGQGCYFRSAPKLTLMASCTSARVYLYDFQFFLLIE